MGTALSSTTGSPLRTPLPELQLLTEASTEAGGADLTTHQTSGLWSTSQKALHTNNPELPAVHLTLQHFLVLVIGKSVVVMMDNTAVVGRIKNQGGTQSRSLYRQTVLLLEWGHDKDITLIPSAILGHLNVVADRLSRRLKVINAEWRLSLQVLHHVWCLYGDNPRSISLPHPRPTDCPRSSRHYRTRKRGESTPCPFLGRTCGYTRLHPLPSPKKSCDGCIYHSAKTY